MGIFAAIRINFWIVLASMVGFGSMVQSTDLGLGIAVGATVGLWGLPGQVAMVEVFATGAPLFAVIIASSLANLRFMPMSVVMMPLFRGRKLSVKLKLIIAQLMSVNIWTIAMQQIQPLSPQDKVPFYLGVSLTCLFGGILGTIIGFFLAGVLPLYVTVSLVFLNPVYFVFVFSSVRQRNCIIAVIIAAIFGPIFYKITPSWSAPLTGVLIGSLAFYLDQISFSQRKDRND